MENKNQPIHPLEFDSQKDTQNMGYVSKFRGLTKREYFAGLAMQGMLSGHELQLSKAEADVIAMQSIQFADALLEALSN